MQPINQSGVLFSLYQQWFSSFINGGSQKIAAQPKTRNESQHNNRDRVNSLSKNQIQHSGPDNLVN
jgi:hypothetical protein